MKKNCCIYFLFPLFFFINGNFLKAQQRIDTLITHLGEMYPQEKIYLHTDKNFYIAGETIWFKAYLASDNFITALSKTVYAELINDAGQILQKKIMPVYQSGAAAHFELPDTLSNSKLFIRAYTSWMLNFDSTLLYLKPVYIIATGKPAKKTAETVSYSLTFFPEGGDLIDSIESRVAFKATDNTGTPFNITGILYNSSGKKITSFTSVHDGMGYFVITPEPSEKYKAIWKDNKGITHETLLPLSKKQGVSLSINMAENKLFYTLKRPDSAADAFTSFTVITQMQHQLYYNAKINLKKRKEVTAPVDLQNFPDGILQFTVFNADEIPVAERLVFINNNNYYFATDLHAIEKNLTKHGRNTLQIDVGDTLLTNLSIAVTDAAINPVTPNEENIFSGMLLTSDIKGYVYNPAYYFSSDADSVKEHVDLVMMTNGWRRFKWEDLLARRWPKLIYPVDNYLSITGKIYGLNKTQLANKDLIGYIQTKSKTSDIISIPLSTDGQFRLSGIYVFDTAKMYYQFNNDKDKKLTGAANFSFKNEIANPPAPSTALLSLLPFTLKYDSSSFQKNANLFKLLQAQQQGNKVKTLEVVKVTGKTKSLKQKMDEEYTSGFFSGGDGYTFTTEDDPFAKSAISVLDYLRGKVAGLQVDTDGNGVSWRGSEPSIFLNETNTDLSVLNTISMNDVAMIKVFRPPFFGAIGGGAGGAIAVYTKKGVNNTNVKGLDFTNIYGYSAIKEFYMPDYEKTNATDVPDYRSTLYWNPFLILDKKTRRIKIPFYNSDNCKRIRVVIEGVNKKGQVTHEEKFFE